MKILVNILCETDSKIIGQDTEISMELSTGTSIKQVMDKLELQPDAFITLVNGKKVGTDYVFSNGDILCIASK